MNWTIAGRKMPPHILGWEGSEGIEVPGEVADAAAAIQAHPVMLVPLLSGSGMRVKILEALALGRVVLTTTIGLEGIPARHKEEVMVADTAAEMVAALRFLGDQPRRMAEIGQNARNFVVQQFDYHEIGRQLHDAYLAH